MVRHNDWRLTANSGHTVWLVTWIKAGINACVTGATSGADLVDALVGRCFKATIFFLYSTFEYLLSIHPGLAHFDIRYFSWVYYTWIGIEYHEIGEFTFFQAANFML